MRLGIYGCGNLGLSLERAAIADSTEVAAMFTRRNTTNVKTISAPVYNSTDVERHADKIDVLAVCGGSAHDLPTMTPTLARTFSVIDSYDNHGEIAAHVGRVDEEARRSGHTAIVGCGWDPGMFSLARLYFSAFFQRGSVTTYWGRGVSQGHSEAVRRIEGVLDARQYTIPREDVLEEVRRGIRRASPTELHRREVYVVAADGADRARIGREIRSLNGYFKGYETSVTFISAEEMARDHGSLPHGGGVIAAGGEDGRRSRAELTLSLESNPDFTAGVLLAYAKAAYRLNRRGEYGARTVFDIAARDLLDTPLLL